MTIVALKQKADVWRNYATQTLNQQGGDASPVDRYVKALPYDIQINAKVQTFIEWARDTDRQNRHLNKKVRDLEAYIKDMEKELRVLKRTTIYQETPPETTGHWVDVKTYAGIWGKSPSRVYDYIRTGKVDFQAPPEGKNGYKVNADVAPRLGKRGRKK